MSFLWTDMLWALLLLPALVIAYVLAQRRRKKYALRYSNLSLVKEALGRGPGVRRHIPAALFLLGLAIALFGLARPVATVMLPSQQGTVILTLDVSGSMRADDLKPNRLEAAKAAAISFVEHQPRNIRIGVVSFSGDAAIVQAPTTDREAVFAAIGRLTPQRATAVGSGILTSLDAIFEEPSARPTPFSRRDPLRLSAPTPTPTPVARGAFAAAVIVLLSDGQSNAGPRPLQAATQAANRGVRVYTVGVGNPQGTVLRFDGRSMRVRLDEETLKRIADETDASYVRADSETDLRQIYENLSTQLVFKPEQTELTVGFTGLATVFLLLSGTLSLLWFNHLP
ncbi:MAG: VWA domain-containing protein [Chloroflexi bacterium]|nr:VWA domain-containing protein [Chloroflexota bacterium]